ncbi:MAG: hypothetical protein A2Y69_09615 [Candidatus Aminicenantes bacterium RBG_13_59_9]|nr:MAG: hypothetical protein A2Y69_09615 [Candidatus Aminicenantes bacterium RBG_13_59_9]
MKSGRSRGFTLIIVILVLAFLLSVGVALLSVTGAGPRLADNVRTQEQALNAAEAGFDSAWGNLGLAFEDGEFTSFDGIYLKDPEGVDLPTSENYFRKKTDWEMLSLLDQDGDGAADYTGVLFYKQYFLPLGSESNSGLTYTVFLIDDEAAGGAMDHTDVLLVCIGTSGRGSRSTTSRLEILIGVEGS